MKANVFLRIARTTACLTQDELAEAVGTTAMSISRWERGEHLPSAFFRQRLGAVLHIAEDDFQWSMKAGGQETQTPLSPHAAAFSLDPIMKHTPPPLMGQQHLLQELLHTRKRMIGVCGIPGCGKTALAQTLARMPDLCSRFEGVLWATVGLRQPDHALRHLQRWLQLLGDEILPGHLASAQDRLSLLLRRRHLLLILDDVWAADDLAPYLVGGENCSYLITTRQPALAHTLCERVFQPRPLTKGQAFHLLTSGLPSVLIREHHLVLHALSQQVGCLPAALVQLRLSLHHEAQLRSPRRWQTALALLFHPSCFLHLRLQPQMPSLAAALQQSEQELSASTQQVFRLLAAQFPAAPAVFVEHQLLDLFHTQQRGHLSDVDRLVDAGLLSLSAPNQYHLHPVIAAYARLPLHPSDQDDGEEVECTGAEYTAGTEAVALSDSGEGRVNQAQVD